MFRRRVQVPEVHGIQVQVLMIEFFKYLIPHDARQHFHIHYITRFGIRLTGYLHDQLIVMPVIIRVAAFTKYLRILLIVPGRVEDPMGRIKMFLPENRYFFYWSHSWFLELINQSIPHRSWASHTA